MTDRQLPAAVDVHRALMPDGKHLTLFDVALVLDAIRAVDVPAADTASDIPPCDLPTTWRPDSPRCTQPVGHGGDCAVVPDQPNPTCPECGAKAGETCVMLTFDGARTTTARWPHKARALLDVPAAVDSVIGKAIPMPRDVPAADTEQMVDPTVAQVHAVIDLDGWDSLSVAHVIDRVLRARDTALLDVPDQPNPDGEWEGDRSPIPSPVRPDHEPDPMEPYIEGIPAELRDALRKWADRIARGESAGVAGPTGSLLDVPDQPNPDGGNDE